MIRFHRLQASCPISAPRVAPARSLVMAAPVMALLLIPLLACPLPLRAANAPDPARCAALWLGLLDVAETYPGYFGDMSNTRALAESFRAKAGPEALPRIAAERGDMALIAKAKVIGQDQISSRLFDQLAEDCATLE